jgi:hypothetical protein
VDALDFGAFVAQARAFLGRFHRPPRPLEEGGLRGAFASAAEGAPDLYGAADAAYALWILGDLERLTSPDDREAWSERIRAQQDPRTGWFDRSRLAGHGVPHATAFATGALTLLGSAPAAPLRYAEALFADRASVDAWLDGFGWQQIWTGSHAAGAAAAVIDAPAGLSLPGDWGATVLDALEARVDPRTGLWKRALHDRLWRRPTTLDLGGAAHFWWLFDRLGRPVPRPDLAIESILGLQRRTGLWGSRVFGGRFPQGIDFDALHGLRVAWRDRPAAVSDARRASLRARIRTALDRYTRAAHAWLSPDGAVERWLRTPHKLVGTLDALAELDLAARAILGEPRVRTPSRLRSALIRVAWQ